MRFYTATYGQHKDTHRIQVLVLARAWRFKSSSGHQKSRLAIGRSAFFVVETEDLKPEALREYLERRAPGMGRVDSGRPEGVSQDGERLEGKSSSGH
jgi:hypothetical protein